MTRTLKRRLYWGTAGIIAAAYVLSLTIYWAGGWHAYPAGISGLVILAVTVLFIGGLHAGQVMVVVRDEPLYDAKEAAALRQATAPALAKIPVDAESVKRAKAIAYVDRMSGLRPSRRRFRRP